jgi:flagellin
MRDLAVQAMNEGSQDSDAQAAANTEFQQLNSKLTRISDTTKFGKTNIFDGAYNKAFQVGANGGEIISVALTQDFDASSLSVGSDVLTSAASASTALGHIDTAIKTVSTERAKLGALQNRFEHTINNLSVAVENLSASESRVRDTDMAQEMMSFTRSQILSQAGTAMLAQANQAPQGVLSLLR